jgi:hypothetical protein
MNNPYPASTRPAAIITIPVISRMRRRDGRFMRARHRMDKEK